MVKKSMLHKDLLLPPRHNDHRIHRLNRLKIVCTKSLNTISKESRDVSRKTGLGSTSNHKSVTPLTSSLCINETSGIV